MSTLYENASLRLAMDRWAGLSARRRLGVIESMRDSISQYCATGPGALEREWIEEFEVVIAILQAIKPTRPARKRKKGGAT